VESISSLSCVQSPRGYSNYIYITHISRIHRRRGCRMSAPIYVDKAVRRERRSRRASRHGRIGAGYGLGYMASVGVKIDIILLRSLVDLHGFESARPHKLIHSYNSRPHCTYDTQLALGVARVSRTTLRGSKFQPPPRAPRRCRRSCGPHRRSREALEARHEAVEIRRGRCVRAAGPGTDASQRERRRAQAGGGPVTLPRLSHARAPNCGPKLSGRPVLRS
jgi:hypothetical protein